MATGRIATLGPRDQGSYVQPFQKKKARLSEYNCLVVKKK